MSAFTDLKDVLACPACKSQLQEQQQRIACLACGRSFAQLSGDFVNLILDEDDNSGSRWLDRQQEMYVWYRESLIDDPKESQTTFQLDYEPFSKLLSSMAGTVLDVGGGVGYPLRLLPASTEYICLEPSLDWVDSRWSSALPTEPNSRPKFVQGVGEHMPIRSGSCDAVLSFWSLNHAWDPVRYINEMARVLRPGGRAVIALEQVEPGWSDLITYSLGLGARPHLRLLFAKCLTRLRGRPWPVQPDHLLITEEEFVSWVMPQFQVVERAWRRGDLTYELRLGQRAEPDQVVRAC